MSYSTFGYTEAHIGDSETWRKICEKIAEHKRRNGHLQSSSSSSTPLPSPSTLRPTPPKRDRPLIPLRTPKQMAPSTLNTSDLSHFFASLEDFKSQLHDLKTSQESAHTQALANLQRVAKSFKKLKEIENQSASIKSAVEACPGTPLPWHESDRITYNQALEKLQSKFASVSIDNRLRALESRLVEGLESQLIKFEQLESDRISLSRELAEQVETIERRIGIEREESEILKSPSPSRSSRTNELDIVRLKDDSDLQKKLEFLEDRIAKHLEGHQSKSVRKKSQRHSMQIIDVSRSCSPVKHHSDRAREKSRSPKSNTDKDKRPREKLKKENKTKSEMNIWLKGSLAQKPSATTLTGSLNHSRKAYPALSQTHFSPEPKKKKAIDLEFYSMNLKSIIIIQRFFRRSRRKQRRKIANDTLQNVVVELRTSQTSKRWRQRAEIENEIYNTEKIYVDSLEFVIKSYLNPIRQSNLVKAEDVKKIFSNIEIIANCNSILLKDLKKYIDAPVIAYSEFNFNIGTIFNQLAPIMKMYIEYCNNYSTMITTLERMMKQKATYQFFDELMVKSGRIGELTSYLIQPIQRIPRYVMLLQELLKCTQASITEHADINEALSALKDVAILVNENKRKFEGLEKALETRKCISGLTLNLVQPHRFWIREGPLGCKLEKSNKVQDLYLFLFNDILIYTKKQSTLTKLSAKPFVYEGDVRLHTAAVSSEDPDPMSFRLLYPQCETGIVFVTKDPELKMSWKEDITNAIHRLFDLGTITQHLDDSCKPLIKSGYLHKKSSVLRNWKNYYIELKGESLFYYFKYEDPVPKKTILLVDLKLTKHVDVGKNAFGFKLTSPAKEKEYVFSTSKQSDYEEWVALLESRVSATL